MDKGNRPVGREKRVGEGTGDVEKRGEGLSGRTDGPVGNPDGYSDRSDGSFGNQPTSSTNYGAPFRNSGTPGTKSPKAIIVFIIIAIIAYSLYSCYQKKSQSPGTTSQVNSTTPTNVASYVDKGEYPVSTTVSNKARNKYTSLRGSGRDVATIMVYMCGTDLESKDGAATADIQEMLYATLSDNVNIIIQTGGATQWQNKVISSKTNQRFRLRKDGLELLEDNLGRKSMVNPNTLTDFIKYGVRSFPADRNILIMWDHGGGSLNGFGYDEFFPSDSMTLAEISTALDNAKCKFDVIGFDACLMATLETAIAVEPYADYLIASEETESGVGWDYTGWLTNLSQNTSRPAIEYGKVLIDDYVKDVYEQDSSSQATLSMIDLAELKGTLPTAFTSFAKSTSKLIDEDHYKTVSDARANSKEFARSSKINQVDLIHLTEKIATPESKALATVLRGCIKYNRCTTNITDANGVSIFFPYEKLAMLDPMLSTYDQIGVDSEYSDCIRSFASVAAGGQIVSSGSNNMLQSLMASLNGNTNSNPSSGTGGVTILQQLLNEFLAKGDFSSITGLLGGSLGWLDIDKIKSYLTSYAKNKIEAKDLVITEKEGQKVLALTEKQWDMIQHMEMNVFIDDGKGFIDLGLDNVYEYNDDGDLIMEYDGTWLALNGHIVSYYFVSEDRHGESYTINGRIPALLNNKLVDIIVVFDNLNPSGKVMGAKSKYVSSNKGETIAKGLIEISAGDKIDFLCDYYTYQGKYNDTYMLGKQYVATGQWKVENLSVGKKKYKMTYRFTDIYNNHFWSPSI